MKKLDILENKFEVLVQRYTSLVLSEAKDLHRTEFVSFNPLIEMSLKFPECADLAIRKSADHESSYVLTPSLRVELARIICTLDSQDYFSKLRFRPNENGLRTFRFGIMGNLGSELESRVRLIIDSAMDSVLAGLPALNPILKYLSFCTVPLVSDEPKYPKGGFSTQIAHGLVFLTPQVALPQRSATTIAAFDLVHEIGHQVLMLYQRCSDMFICPQPNVYSPIRTQYRPAIQAFHGTVACYFMVKFYEQLRRVDLPHIDMALAEILGNRALENMRLGVAALTNLQFSEVGWFVFSEVRKYLVGLNLFS